MYYISIGDNWSPPTLTAYDAVDGYVEVSYSGEYNVYEIGIYTITYTAFDNSNNVSRLTIYLYVVGDEIPDDFPEMDEEVLAEIKAKRQSERDSLIPTYTDPFDPNVYYATLEGLTGQAFFDELRRIISTNIRQITYDQVRFILEKSDAIDTPWGTYIYGIYSGDKIIRYWDDGKTWAREHVWPNSKLGVKDQVRQAADPHNLRAINPSVNSTRSNRYFTYGLGQSTWHTVGTYGFYPGDDHRGDVARILFYMYVRYFDILDLVDTVEEILAGENYQPSGANFGLLSVLIEWHLLDPVSDFERHRNDVIYSYQGNRNPFIDNPEYVYIIFNIESAETHESVTITIVVNKVEVDINDLNKRKYSYI